MPIIGVINQKGGVGKTTTAVNLSAALSERRRILLVDLDPQANASSGVGVTAPERTVYDVISGRASARQSVVRTGIENLDLLAASGDLAGAAVELDASRDNLMLLSRGLIGVRPNYDFIIVDAPPSMGALTLNALGASDQLIIPLQTEYYALEGIAGMMDTVERVRGSLNRDLRILGILLTMFDSRTRLSQEVEENVRRHFGTLVFKSVIPRTVRLAEAPSYGKSVLEYAPTSQGALAYQSMAEEVIERVSEA
ncbi:MAG TPA: ParA family protein [Trueperaceae bacterium]|nr:ParA family protein [Trueperaceae bacterium]